MNIDNIRNIIRKPIHSQPCLKPARSAAVLSRQDLQKIVAEMVG